MLQFSGDMLVKRFQVDQDKAGMAECCIANFYFKISIRKHHFYSISDECSAYASARHSHRQDRQKVMAILYSDLHTFTSRFTLSGSATVPK
jgi:hypothetical protein